jgi:phosphohistidine phosphatase
VGAALAARGERPELVLASPAVRVRETLDAFLAAAGVAVAPRFEDALYGAGAAELAQRVRALPPGTQTVLLVGHNPAVEELVGQLTGTASPGMSTSALACLEVDVEWADLDDAAARLAWLVRPQDLG